MTPPPAPATLPPLFADWFARRGWSPRRHQLEMIAAAQGQSHALLVAPTGGGKTLAGFLPSLAELAGGYQGLHTLYISPLKALTADIRRNLRRHPRRRRLHLRCKRRRHRCRPARDRPQCGGSHSPSPTQQRLLASAATRPRPTIF